MKILILSPCQGRIFGGYENWVDELSLQLAKRGFDVHIVTGLNSLKSHHPRIHLHKFPIIKQESIPIRRRPFYEIVGWIEHTSLAWSARDFLSKNKWDVKIVASWTSGWIFKLFLHVSGKTIYTFHTTPLPWLKLLFEPLKDADVTTSVSQYIANYVKKLYGVEAMVIPLGVNLNRFNPNIDGSDVRTDLRIGKQDVMILFVGRLEKKKGIWTFFKAAAKMPKNIHVVYAGTGIEENNLKNASTGMKNIHVIGRVKQSILPKVYAASDVVCVPSEYEEASGSIQMEAMASGKPVIVANIGGLAETPTDYKFKVGDWKDLYDKLIELASDKNKRKSLGLINRKNAVELYDWNKIGQRYAEIMLKLKYREE